MQIKVYKPVTIRRNCPNILVRNGYFFRFQREIVWNLFQFANGAQDLRIMESPFSTRGYIQGKSSLLSENLVPTII